MNVLRDISVIFLAAEVFLMGLIPVAIFGALVYGVWWLRRHKNLPTWLRNARGYLTLGLSYVERAMVAAARPVFVAHAGCAAIKAGIRAISGSKMEPGDQGLEDSC